MNTNEDLFKLFGDYLSPERSGDWDQLKSAIGAGDTIFGKVVALYRFGAFIDFGVGFPALLPVTQFEHANKRAYRSLDDYPMLDSRISARVVTFRDRDRQIGVTQLTPHPYLDGLKRGKGS